VLVSVTNPGGGVSVAGSGTSTVTVTDPGHHLLDETPVGDPGHHVADDEHLDACSFAPVTGTGSTNYVPKWTSPSTLGNSMIYDNGAGVGVGTTSPASGYALHVASPGLYVDANSGSNGLQVQRVGGGHINLNVDSTSGFVQTAASQPLVFQQDGTEIMRLHSNGNVGIGTMSPDSQLHVKRTTGDGAAILTVDGVSSSTGYRLRLQDNGVNRFRVAKEGSTSIDATSIGAGSSALGVSTDSGYAATFTGGDVGIGTSSPGFHVGHGLDIIESTPATIRLDSSSGGSTAVEMYANSTGLIFEQENGARNFVFLGGKIGVGMYSPGKTLDVAGDIRGTTVVYNDAGSLGTCDSSARGTTKLIEGGAGVADVLSMCMKSASDTYAWKAMVTG
jgi:hypothetical protein